jgi:hypothetical protein
MRIFPLPVDGNLRRHVNLSGVHMRTMIFFFIAERQLEADPPKTEPVSVHP